MVNEWGGGLKKEGGFWEEKCNGWGKSEFLWK